MFKGVKKNRHNRQLKTEHFAIAQFRPWRKRSRGKKVQLDQCHTIGTDRDYESTPNAYSLAFKIA